MDKPTLYARIATLEAELAEANRGWQAASAACLAEIDARDMWQARADALRDALEKANAAFNAWGRDEDGIHPEAWPAVEHLREVLLATPAASLAALKAEVLERAAALCDAESHTDGWGKFFALQIRALRGAGGEAVSKPLTMTVEKEREYRACCTSGGTEVDPVFAELDATRAALAAAEAKLELQGFEYAKAMAESELAFMSDIAFLERKLDAATSMPDWCSCNGSHECEGCRA